MGIVEDLSRRLPPDTVPAGVKFEWCADGVGRWCRPAVDYENAADRAARKTAELWAKRRAALEGETNALPGPGPQTLYHGFRDPPEPAPSFWRPKLDKAGLWSAYATAAFCVVALVILFT